METKQEEDSVKKNNYALSDALAKAITIDGFIELVVPFAIPLVLRAPVLNEDITTYPELIHKAVLAAAASIAPATLSYYLRTLARNEGQEYVGGMFGNYGKYAAGGKEDVVSMIAGSSNGLFYEVCNNYKICSEGFGSYISPVFVEVVDQLLQAYLNHYLIASPLFVSASVKTGAVIGVLVAISGNFIYANALSYFKNTGDYVDGFLNGGSVEELQSFKNQASSEDNAADNDVAIDKNMFVSDAPVADENAVTEALLIDSAGSNMAICAFRNCTLMGDDLNCTCVQ